MVLPYALPITALPSVTAAPGVSQIVPFIRPGIPTLVAPPAPVMAPLTVTPPLTTGGGLLPAIGTGAAVVGAGVLGLGIGNAIYEDLLGRPFGPSVGDLFFPDGQPMPLPVPQRLPQEFPGGQCETVYLVGGTGSFFNSFDNKFGVKNFTVGLVKGPLSNPQVRQVGNIITWTIDGFHQTTGVPITKDLGSVTTSFGQVSQGKFTSIELRRDDNQPDNCGSPEYEPLPIPKSNPRPTQPRPDELPKMPQPRPQPEPMRVPAIKPAPEPNFVPFGVPEPETPPTFEPLPPALKLPSPKLDPFPNPQPEPQPEPKTDPDGNPVKPKPPTPTLECCPSLERKLDKLIDRDEPEECDLSEIQELLENILEKLEGDVQGEIDLSPCNAEEPVTSAFEGEGLTGVYSALSAIATSLNLIHEDTSCEPEPCVVAVPDWWQARVGADRPQLAVIFRKGNTRTYHTVNIPHPIVSPRPTESPISPYTAGMWQGTLTLLDNSKFIVNADAKGVAQRVINEARAVIDPAFLGPNPRIQFTQRTGYPVNVAIMNPRYLCYYPRGQQNEAPAWRVNLA